MGSYLRPGTKAFIIENNRLITEVNVGRESGGLYLLIYNAEGRHGGLMLRRSRIYLTREEAMAAMPRAPDITDRPVATGTASARASPARPGWLLEPPPELTTPARAGPFDETGEYDSKSSHNTVARPTNGRYMTGHYPWTWQ